MTRPKLLITHPFDEAVALTPVPANTQEHGRESPRQFDGRPHAAYANMVGPFGGITAATVINGIQQHPDVLGDPLALTINYVAPIAYGDWDLDLQAVRTNRTNQHWVFTINQEDHIVATGSAVFGVVRDTWADTEPTPPEAPPADEVEATDFVEFIEWAKQYDKRFVVGGLAEEKNDDSTSTVWLRDQPARPIDFPSLTSMADCFFPRVFLRHGAYMPAGTISLTVYFHATAEELAIAQHSLEAAKNALWAAQGQRDAVCGGSGGAPGACDAAKGAAQQADEQVRIAEVRLRQVEQGAGAQEISAVRGQVQQVEGQLAAARADVAQAEAALARIETGATAEALAAADAQVAQAEAAVARARLAVERCALLAPYDGVIVAVTARVGEEIGPGVPALQIADTGAWRVETDDLTELDVVRVAVGQRTTVVPDALPDLALEGIVAAVSEMPEDRAGEVLYKVTIDLPEPDPRLRWGMTVAVTFEE